jgi:hypothetical protein
MAAYQVVIKLLLRQNDNHPIPDDDGTFLDDLEDAISDHLENQDIELHTGHSFTMVVSDIDIDEDSA